MSRRAREWDAAPALLYRLLLSFECFINVELKLQAEVETHTLDYVQCDDLFASFTCSLDLEQPEGTGFVAFSFLSRAQIFGGLTLGGRLGCHQGCEGDESLNFLEPQFIL